MQKDSDYDKEALFDAKRVHPYYAFAERELDLDGGEVILDIACGTADFSNQIENHTREVIGLDFSRENLRLIKQKNDRLRLVLGSILDLPFRRGSVDKCVALEVLEHLGRNENMLKALKEINGILGNGKIFVMTTPNKGKFFKYTLLDPASWLRRHHHFSEKELSDLLKQAGFKVKKIKTIGGPLFVLFFYSIFWHIKNWGLLELRLPKLFFNWVLNKVASEFERENNDGCMFIVNATKSSSQMNENMDRENWIDLLACPKCKEPLSNTGMFLSCNQCDLAYPILNNDVPDMLIKDAWVKGDAQKNAFKHSLIL